MKPLSPEEIEALFKGINEGEQDQEKIEGEIRKIAENLSLISEQLMTAKKSGKLSDDEYEKVVKIENKYAPCKEKIENDDLTSEILEEFQKYYTELKAISDNISGKDSEEEKDNSSNPNPVNNPDNPILDPDKSKSPKDPDILSHDEMREAFQDSEMELDGKSNELPSVKLKIDINPKIPSTKAKEEFVKQISGYFGVKLYSGNRREGWMKVTGFYPTAIKEKKIKIEIPKYGKNGRELSGPKILRISLAELNERLNKFNITEEEIERMEAGVQATEDRTNKKPEPKEKTPGTPELMQAKLDELKELLASKKSELKTADSSQKEAIEKEITEINEEINEAGKYFEQSREASKITLNRLRNQTKDLEGNAMGGYEDINAETREEADEKFKEKTRQLWKDLVMHGKIKYNEEKKEFVFIESGDLDVKCCLGLLKQAGINTDYIEYVAQGKSVRGKINIDTGNKEGVIVEDDGTAFFDHHDPNSPRDVSASLRIYETMVKMGMIEEDEAMDRMLKFIDEVENGVYKNLDGYYDNSWKTLRGLVNFANYPNLVKFFSKNDNPDPYRELSVKELKEYGLYFKQKTDGGKEKIITEIVEENVKKDYKTLDNLRKEGFVIDSEKYGKIVVDLGGTIKGNFFASRAFGANAYINWNPEQKSFFLSTEKEMDEEFPQGIKVRGTMLIKPRGNEEPLKMTLEDVLEIMVGKEKLKEILEEKDEDGNRKHEKLIDFFENEFQESKKWRAEIEGEEEKKRKEEEKWKIETHIKIAEEICQEAKEDFWVAKESSRIRAWGVSPYEDLFPGDDYSLRKKVRRRNYEEAKAELERLREIAKDPEKKKQFEEYEKKRVKKEIRPSEIERQLEKAELELNEARNDYAEMILNKKKMWDNVRKFFSRSSKSEDAAEFTEDHDVEYYRNVYEKKMEVVKNLLFEQIKNEGLEREESKRELAKTREWVNLTEAAMFIKRSLDARVENYADDVNSWKIVWTEPKSWLSKTPDKFAKIAERISDSYFRTEDISGEDEKEIQETRKEWEKAKRKYNEEKKKQTNKKIEEQNKENKKKEGKIKEIEKEVEKRAEVEIKKMEEDRKEAKKEIEKREKEIEKIEKENEKKLKLINEISRGENLRTLIEDLMNQYSNKNKKLWLEIKKEKISERIKSDPKFKKRFDDLSGKFKKLFDENADPKENETVLEYVKRMASSTYDEKTELNKKEK